MDKIFIAALFLGIIFFSTYSSKSEEYYENYTQLLSSEALKEGLLPDIKTGSTSINVFFRKGYMIEDPRMVVNYKYTGKGPEQDLLKNSCREKQKGQVTMPSDPPSFWSGQFGESYKFYKCINLNGYYAVSDEDKTAWFWRVKGE